MGFKTITIKEDVYKLIKRAKKEDESFSELFERKFNRKPDIMKYVGILSDKEADEAWKRIKEYREYANRSARERMKRLGLE